MENCVHPHPRKVEAIRERKVRRRTLAGVQVGIRAPRGAKLTCKSWQTEAALRMLMNNLDPEVAEKPAELIVYGGAGKAARNWEAYHLIIKCLRNLESDETLLVQSGKPVGIFKTHEEAPRVLISNAMLVPHWGNWEKFRELEALGLTMYGQMTAGSWIYIGTRAGMGWIPIASGNRYISKRYPSSSRRRTSAYAELPVLVLENWPSLAAVDLNREYVKIKASAFNFERLFMDYYRRSIGEQE